MPKILKRGPSGIFQHPFCRKTSKKLKGNPLSDFFLKKSLTMPKKLKGWPFSLSWYCMLRGKKRKTVLVQFARPNDPIWDHKISNFVELSRTFLISSDGLKKKSHYNSRVSLHETQTKMAMTALQKCFNLRRKFKQSNFSRSRWSNIFHILSSARKSIYLIQK